MASLTQQTWVWVNSGSWRWTGRPGMLQSMGPQRLRQDWVAELNWELIFDWPKENSPATGAGFYKSLPINNGLRTDTRGSSWGISQPHEDTERKGQSTSQEDSPHQNPTMQTYWSMPSSFQTLKDINVCSLSHQSMAFCHSRLNRWTEIALWGWERASINIIS